MKRFVTIFFILLVCPLVSGQRWAYVLNGNAETLSRINLQTGEVVNHIVNTGPVPNQVAYYNGMLYVVNSGSASLQIINPANNQNSGEIQLPINSNPLNVAFYSGFAFISGFLTNSVYKIDLGLNQVVDTIAVGLSPAGLVVAGSQLYVCNTGFNPASFTYGQGSVSVVNINEGEEYTRINVGKNPQALIEGPDGLINVICTGNYSSLSGSIHFIDPSQLTVVDTINIGGEPFWPAVDSEGRCFVSAGGWSGQGKVLCYDAISRRVVRGTGNPIYVGLGAMGLAIDSTGMLYSTSQQANSVSKFNSQGNLLGGFPVGGGPVSVTIIDLQTNIDSDLSVNPTTFKLGIPYPNPFNSQVVIPILGRSDSKSHQAVEIIDICGRVIKSIIPDGGGAVTISVSWDGKNRDGHTASSGIYFARIAGTDKAVRLVLLR